LGAGSLALIEVMLEYGPRYLSQTELAARQEEVINAYYRDLGGSLLKLKPRKFWDFQRKRLQELGLQLDWPRVAKAAMSEAMSEARHPATAASKVMQVMKKKLSR
jgi:hypothetical protein